MKRILLLIAFAWIGLQSFAQIDITGKVVDKETGEGLIGASVIIQGTTIGTITDANGNFSISVRSGEDVLIISFIGFEQQKTSSGPVQAVFCL